MHQKMCTLMIDAHNAMQESVETIEETCIPELKVRLQPHPFFRV